MAKKALDFPIGNFEAGAVAIRSSTELGAAIRQRREQLQLKQTDLAGLGGTGNRFVVDLERGKPTVQLQKVLDLMDLLGLEIVVKPKTSGGL
ncbi:helix-turn-helix transcriptional regulator [Cupriavidus gilardii]|jgi:y4mF family transcriptional regulator|uniref:helix-turn-helix transcriptional regulator n=1 Tax=Cupriavidus gilardii TaxID=82541 RepID=UPI00158112A9|nr:helix-turn-helix transcriptional regulator [Cupriavidus gilardii]MCT9074214.1 helix-turn-helix transcriptional regulator [Cupriavidus gilardii]QKS60643.1 helix-turn-helix transcriptional regulator [Cupriavidus gilardii]UXC36341.1 helix-turn-helix transcriptional regulator [Cupriavidus gilardii]